MHPPSRFTLTRTAYMAECDGCLIFLDTKHDRYSLLSESDTFLVLPLIATNTDEFVPCDALSGHLTQEALNVASDLQSSGLLVAGLNGKRYAPKFYEDPVKELPRPVLAKYPLPGVAEILRLLRAVATAKAMLVTLPLNEITSRVERWKQSSQCSPNWHRFVEQLELYRRVRPLLYNKKNNCLFDTLCLMIFAKKHLSAITWKFGVRLEPFMAHAWLQWDEYVIDDEPATIHNYEVILEA